MDDVDFFCYVVAGSVVLASFVGWPMTLVVTSSFLVGRYISNQL